jgi:hypothetical protein
LLPSSRDKVTKGQEWSPPTAALQNAWTEAAGRINVLEGRLGRQPPVIQNVEIFIKAASAITPGDPASFGDPINIVSSKGEARYDPIFNQVSLESQRFAISKHNVLNGEVGRFVLVGVAWAQVDIQDESDTHADIVDDVLKSKDKTGYAEILYKPPGIGVQWCCLFMGANSRCCNSIAFCSLCANGLAPFEYGVTVAGVISEAGFSNVSEADQDAVRDLINGDHVLPYLG